MICILKSFQEHHCYLSLPPNLGRITHCFSVPFLPLKSERGKGRGEEGRGGKGKEYMAEKLFISCCQMHRRNQLNQKQEKKPIIFSSYSNIGTLVVELVRNISDVNLVFS